VRTSRTLRTSVIFVLVTVVFSFVEYFAYTGLSRRLPAPAVVVLNPRLDLGAGKPNEVMRGTILFKNQRKVRLPYSITHSCGCTKVEPMSGTLGPGEQGSVEVTVTLSGYTDSEKNVTVTIHSNDGNDTETTCLISARCPAPFAVSPSIVEFGQVTLGRSDDVIQEVRVERGREPDSRSLKQLKALCSSDAFHVLVAENTGDHVLYRVGLAREAGQKECFGTLELDDGASEDHVRIPMHVQFVGSLVVIPSIVFIRQDDQIVDLIILRRDQNASIDPIKLAGAPRGVKLEEISAGESGGNLRRVKLRVSGSEEALQNRSEISFSVGEPASTCSLKVVRSTERGR
jgi:Protein of unknown function (DUF1573)